MGVDDKCSAERVVKITVLPGRGFGLVGYGYKSKAHARPIFSVFKFFSNVIFFNKKKVRVSLDLMTFRIF